MFLLTSLTKVALCGGTKQFCRSSATAFYSKSTYKGFKGHGSSKNRGNQPETHDRQISPYIGYRNESADRSNTKKANKHHMNDKGYGSSRHGFQQKYGSQDYSRGKPSKSESYRPKSSQSTRAPKRATNIADDDATDIDDDDDDDEESEIIKLDAPDWSTIEPLEVNRNVYEPSTKTSERCGNLIADYRRRNGINIKGESPAPIFDPDELNGPRRLIDNILGENIEKFTPLQSFGIPIALSGSDLIGIGGMGCGKKLTALLPAIMHLSKQPPSSAASSPVAVILVPSLELADEFQAMARSLCDSASFQCHVLAQNPRGPGATQKIDLLFASPESLYDSLLTKSVNLHRCSYFAYYEFDRMLDMAMDEEIQQIHAQLWPNCQKIVLSTQWTNYVRNYALGITTNFARLAIDAQHRQPALSANAKHVVKISEETHKKQTLVDIVGTIMQSKQHKTLIFAETKQRANKAIQTLRRSGFDNVDVLHNGRTKEQLQRTLDAFDSDQLALLVLTDVAARYRTFRSVANVVSYDLPFSMADFRLRLGHCTDGRRAADGTTGGITAYTIFSEENGYLIDEFIGMLHQANQPIEPAMYLMRAMYMDGNDELAYALPCQDSDGIQVFRIDKDAEDK